MRISFGKTRSARSLVAQGRFFCAVGLCRLNTLILKRNALALKGLFWQMPFAPFAVGLQTRI